jgi:hypothetical protein
MSEPCPAADVGGVSPVPAPTWQRCACTDAADVVPFAPSLFLLRDEVVRIRNELARDGDGGGGSAVGAAAGGTSTCHIDPGLYASADPAA